MDTQEKKSIKSIIEDQKKDECYIKQILLKQKFNSDLYKILENLKKLKNEDDTKYQVIKEFVEFLKKNETKNETKNDNSLMEFIEYIREEFLLQCISKNVKLYDYIVVIFKNHENDDDDDKLHNIIYTFIQIVQNNTYYKDDKPKLYQDIVSFAQNIQKIMVTFLEK